MQMNGQKEMATQGGQENEKTWKNAQQNQKIKKEWKNISKVCISTIIEIRRGKENKREK